MGSQGSLVLKPQEELRLNVCSESMEINRASQDGRKPTSFEDNQRMTDQLETKEVPVEGSSEGTASKEATQDGRTSTLFEVYQRITNHSEAKDIHVVVSSKGMITDKVFQGPVEVVPTPVVDEKYRPLFEAAQKGHWKTVEKKLKNESQAMTAAIMKVEDETVTVLDVAIMASQDELVKNLIKHILEKDKKFDFSISLERAARGGRIKMVKALLNRVNYETGSVCNALRIATTCAPRQKKVIWYMAKRTNSPPVEDTMPNLIMAGHSDVALYLALQYKVSLAETKIILEYLAKMESNFWSGARQNFWERLFGKCIPLCLVDTSFNKPPAPAVKQFKISLWSLATKPGAGLLLNRIGLRHRCSVELANLVLTEMKSRMKTPIILKLLSSIVLEAASRGIFEIVKLCFEHFPELTWNESLTTELIKEVVNGRHVELFRLLNTPGTLPFSTVKTTRKDVWMKAVAKWSPRCVPKDVFGPHFIMQRELQWFKVLRDTRDPSSKTGKLKNILRDTIDSASKSWRLPGDEKPCWDDFVENRKQLLKEAQQWMKDTSSSCSLVSTLIITITFAAVFTLPGDKKDKWIQDDEGRSQVMVYVAANALALSSAVTATLMFLANLTSRYAAEDFLMSLPRKMILGLTFLFLSLALMLVSFSSALTLVLSELITKKYNPDLRLIYIPITFFATLVAILFAILQLPLYLEMLESTYWPGLYRPLKLWK